MTTLRESATPKAKPLRGACWAKAQRDNPSLTAIYHTIAIFVLINRIRNRIKDDDDVGARWAPFALAVERMNRFLSSAYLSLFFLCVYINNHEPTVGVRQGAVQKLLG